MGYLIKKAIIQTHGLLFSNSWSLQLGLSQEAVMSRRVSIVLFCMLIILFTGPVLAVRGAGLSQTAAKPEEIKVGIYLIRAGSLDITTGAIDVDFYIEFRCPTTCGDKAEFEIINGITKSKPVLLPDPTNPNADKEPTYRVAATVFQDVNLKKYPFDSHDVKIIIESSNYDDTVVKYIVNEETTAIDPKVFILGWDFDTKPPKATASIVDQLYIPWDSHYTRYVFTTHISKPPLAGWLKGLLPAIIIVLGSLFSLFITSKNVGNRVAIITSALVASVLYHMNFTSRVPPIGYLTYADTFMIINYFVLLISLSMTIWIIRSDIPDKQPLIARMNRIELIVVPILWLVLHSLNYLWILR